MNLKQLVQPLTFYETKSNLEHIEINGIEMDSRKIQAGNLFICINGFTVDGHHYAKQAEDNGAVAIIAKRPLEVSVPVVIVRDTSRALAVTANYFFNHPTQNLHLVGVTGTNGKTTVTYLLESIFNEHQRKTGLIGTIQMKIGDAVYDVNNTTPDALSLQKSFQHMVDQNVDTALMEVSSHALDQGRVYGCDFDIGVFTNLSQDHLDYHSSMDDYLRAKSLLFAQLGSRYDRDRLKYAVINQDDTSCSVLKRSTSQPVLTYGIDLEADVQAMHIQLDATGSKFNLISPIGEVSITSKLMGKFSVYNMLAAAGAAICAGVDLKTIKNALETTAGVSGRLEPVAAGQSFGVVVDYAHTPDSLENVLQTIQSFAKGNTYVVVGCGGDRDKTKRPLMANVALAYADYAIFTSDNPRSEDPARIIEDMVHGLEGRHYEQIVDRKQAIERVVEMATTDDVVLIAGKGHETYQEIGGHTINFDDRHVAAQAINEKF